MGRECVRVHFEVSDDLVALDQVAVVFGVEDSQLGIIAGEGVQPRRRLATRHPPWRALGALAACESPPSTTSTANSPPLEAVLEDVERAAPDPIVIGGDIASLGPMPRETLDRLLTLQRHAPFIRGNTHHSLVSHYDGTWAPTTSRPQHPLTAAPRVGRRTETARCPNPLFTHDHTKGWSINGAERAQPVAIGGKSGTVKDGENRRIRNPSQRTATVRK